MKLPEVEVTNRFGLRFGRSRRASTYQTSGRKFRDYYSFVCLRCGWAFCKPRHLAHRLWDCNLVLAQLVGGDKGMLRYVRENLLGRRRQRSAGRNRGP